MPDSPRPRCTFGARSRVRKRADFQRTLRAGQRATDTYLTVWLLPNGLSYSRLGLIVGRKHGGAAQRNRLKRLIREGFRLTRHKLPPGYDVLCMPRATAKLDLADYKESLLRLTLRLTARGPGVHDR